MPHRRKGCAALPAASHLHDDLSDAAMIFAGRGGPSIEADGSQSKENTDMQKITPFLWFDTKAEEAAKFYTSIFKNSGIVSIARYGEAGPGPKGSVMTVAFKLDGQDFVALNGGPQFQFTLAISFVVNCNTQEEVDYFWRKLSEGGKTDRCGWLKDKFGLSWQVVPTIMGELLGDKNAKKANRVMEAMLQMDKMEIDKLKQAYERG